VRFLADMGISPRTVAHVRSLGHEAVHLRDDGLERLPDSAVLEKARREERILLTHDLDFADLLAAGGYSLPSTILFRLRDMRPDCVNRHLDAVIAQCSAALERGAIVSVTEGLIRVRPLPLRAAGRSLRR
jgi:predicted nuclease of predicted toxin-antitoxin system